MLDTHSSHQSPQDYEKHIEEHFEFSTKILEIHQQIQEGNSTKGEEIINYLCQWLVVHILHTDQVMVQTIEK
jgi:hemerythrin